MNRWLGIITTPLVVAFLVGAVIAFNVSEQWVAVECLIVAGVVGACCYSLIRGSQ